MNWTFCDKKNGTNEKLGGKAPFNIFIILILEIDLFDNNQNSESNSDAKDGESDEDTDEFSLIPKEYRKSSTNSTADAATTNSNESNLFSAPNTSVSNSTKMDQNFTSSLTSPLPLLPMSSSLTSTSTNKEPESLHQKMKKLWRIPKKETRGI